MSVLKKLAPILYLTPIIAAIILHFKFQNPDATRVIIFVTAIVLKILHSIITEDYKALLDITKWATSAIIILGLATIIYFSLISMAWTAYESTNNILYPALMFFGTLGAGGLILLYYYIKNGHL